MSTLLPTRPPVSVEMTSDPQFARRIKRLVAVSGVALGGILLLQVATTDAGWVAVGLMIGGWVAMPSVLTGSLAKPQWRYLLAAPATMVSSSLIVTAVGFDGSNSARLGWWLIVAGVLFGGTLGTWFWYRWMPVPRIFDEPFSAGRWALVAAHAGLVVLGALLVVFAELF